MNANQDFSAPGVFRFEDLSVGDAFQICEPTGLLGRMFFKTGPESYGLSPDQAEWPWIEPWPVLFFPPTHNEPDNVIELFPQTEKEAA